MRSSSTSRTASRRDGAGVSELREERFNDVELIAGNVATEEGARFLVENAVSRTRSASGLAAAA